MTESYEPNDAYSDLGGSSTKGEAAREKIRRDIATRAANRPIRDAAEAQAERERLDRAATDRIAAAHRDIEASLFRVAEKNSIEEIRQTRLRNEEQIDQPKTD